MSAKQKENIKILESDIKKQIKEYLKWNGWFCFHILAGMGMYKGIPDLIAIKNGILLFIEVKQAKGRQSLYQKKFQENIELYGGDHIKYILVHNIDELIQNINTLKN